MNILVVDDNPRNIQIVGKILTEHQYKIAYATSGSRALELAKQHDFDLILLDIMMPEMDGYEVCLLLKSNVKTCEVPIIFLTAKIDPESIVKGFEAGANDYVTKPFNAAELIARVKTQLELSLRRKELDRLNKDLELIVKERTRQLEDANARLTRLEKSKSDFLSIMGHELRTPLNALAGLNNLMQSTPLDEEQREFLLGMEEASGRLARFSEMALLITALQSNDQQAERFPLIVSVLFEMALRELHYAIQEKSIQVKLADEVDRLLVMGDAELIRRCLVILIENAVNHLPAEGIIELKAFQTEPNRVCLQVCDNGSGFSDEMLDLFQAGHQTDWKTVKVSGSLSLTAVKLIMSAHGGDMAVKNRPEGGAQICLLFSGRQA